MLLTLVKGGEAFFLRAVERIDTPLERFPELLQGAGQLLPIVLGHGPALLPVQAEILAKVFLDTLERALDVAHPFLPLLPIAFFTLGAQRDLQHDYDH